MKDYFLPLYQYEFAACRQVVEMLEDIPSQQLPPKVPAIMSHLLCAQHIWATRLMEEKSELPVWVELPAEKWESWLKKNQNDLNTVIQQITDWKTSILYHSSSGKAYRNTPHEILQHLLLHGSYHRGQLVLLVRPQVETPPLTDYIYHIRQPE